MGGTKAQNIYIYFFFKLYFQSTLHLIEFAKAGGQHMHSRKLYLRPMSALFYSKRKTSL